MMIETQDQAYEFFVQESTELLQILEQGLMNLSQVHEMQKLHELMRAAHSIKGGAACVGFMGVQYIAHDLENGIRALYAEETVFDLELEELFLQAFDCLRSPIVEQIETGFSNEEAAVKRSKPIFEQLEAKLGHSLEEAAELPEVPMEGDMTAFLFAEEVPSGLRRWESVLKAEDESKIRAELKTQAEVFSTLGSMLGLSGFCAIADTVLKAIDVNPQACRQIGQIALADLWASRDAVIAGDRSVGGKPSETLTALSQPVTVAASTTIETSDPSDLFILPPLSETAPVQSPTPQSDTELSISELLLQGLECLRLPLLEQIETGHSQPEQALVKIQAIVQQLEAKLGCSVQEITDSSETHPTLLAEVESQDQTHIELELREEFKTQMEVFITLGQMLNQPQLSALASTSVDALEQQTQGMVTIGLLAFTGIYDQQKAKWKEQGFSVSSESTFSESINFIEAEKTKYLEEVITQEKHLQLSPIVSEYTQEMSIFDRGLETIISSESLSDIRDEYDHEETVHSEIHSLTIEETDIDEIETEDKESDLVSQKLNEETIQFETDVEQIETEDKESDLVSQKLNEETIQFETDADEIETEDKESDLVSQKLNEETIQFETDIDEIKTEYKEPISVEKAPENTGLYSQEKTQNIENKNSSIKPILSSQNQANNITDSKEKTSRTPIQPQLSLGVRVDINRLDQLNNLVGELATQDNSLLLQNQKSQDAIDLIEISREKFRKLSVELQTRSRFLAQQKKSHARIAIEANALSKSVQETLDELDKIRASIYDMKLLNLQSQQTIKKRQHTLHKVQKNLTETRMISVESLFSRFPRMIRDLSIRTQKSVNIELIGEKTLVDKAILEKLYDPLVHLIRNAFDHGIELPEERLEQGKPKEGKIEIKAYHQGNYTYIEVRDDGRGIDVNKIRNKAISKQIISIQDAARLSTKQLYDLLFYPDFSTTETVSELSGRGVGLEAVRHQIEALKGSITIQSTFGKGTQFVLRLPWTLTITKLLVFRVKNNLFSIPMDALAGIVSVSATDIKIDEIAQEKANKQPQNIYDWYGQKVPLVQSLLLEYNHPSASVLTSSRLTKKANHSLPEQSSNKVMLLLISQGLETIALKVDQILMEQNLTIKPFNKILAAPPFCYGCTILGDGQLVPVVDSPELLEHWRQQQQSHINTLTLKSDPPQLTAHSNPTILVIDDSLTTRASLSSTLQKAGYEVLQAKQGREGLTQLHNHSQIQVVICDLEMPEMNGFEFLTHCRREYSRDKLPVIILTSRNNDRHRQLAKQLGSNQYLTKPWKEIELIQTLQQFIAQSMAVS